MKKARGEIEKWRDLQRYLEPIVRLLEEKNETERGELIEKIFEMEFGKKRINH